MIQGDEVGKDGVVITGPRHLHAISQTRQPMKQDVIQFRSHCYVQRKFPMPRNIVIVIIIAAVVAVAVAVAVAVVIIC